MVMIMIGFIGFLMTPSCSSFDMWVWCRFYSTPWRYGHFFSIMSVTSTLGNRQVYVNYHLNNMAGPRGLIGPWLSHKLCSIVNITLDLSTKVAIDCSHHELHMVIQLNFFWRWRNSSFLSVSYSYFRWIFGEIGKNKFLSEAIRRET